MQGNLASTSVASPPWLPVMSILQCSVESDADNDVILASAVPKELKTHPGYGGSETDCTE